MSARARVDPQEAALLGLLLVLNTVLCIGTYYHMGEDAYITFRYARNFADGAGLVYNAGEHVEGYSNLLWTLLLGIAGKFSERLDIAAKLLSTLAFNGAIAGAWWAGRRMCAEQPVVRWWLAAAIALDPLLHFHNDQGLETVSYAALLSGAMLVIGCGGRLWIAGILGALAAISRPEGIGFVAALAPAAMLRASQERRSVLHFLAFAAPPCIAFAAQLLFRKSTYGLWVPNTMIAKRGAPGGWIDLAAMVCSRAFVPALGAFGAVLAMWRSETRTLALGVLGSLAAAAVFQVLSGRILTTGFRYLAPAWIPALAGVWLLAQEAAAFLESARDDWRRRATEGAIAAALMIPVPLLLLVEDSRFFRGNTDAPRSRFHVRLGETSTWDLHTRWTEWLAESVFINADAGRWAAANLPKDAVLAADQMGQFGWYAPQTVVDLLGLTDSTIARSWRHGGGPTVEYLKQRGVKFLVVETCDETTWWPRDWRLGPHARGLAPLFASEAFRAQWRPRWFLRSRLGFARVGFMVYVARDADDGAPMQDVPIGADEARFERAWRVL